MSFVGGLLGAGIGFLVGGPTGATAGYGIGSSLFNSGSDNGEVSAQIQAYREQTELTKKELALKQQQTEAEKRRVSEKQIRSLRNQYSPRGLLSGSAGAPTNAVNQKLGT